MRAENRLDGWMPVIRGREKRRGVGPHLPELRGRVDPDRYAKASRIADAIGVSVGTYLDELVKREELDEHGRPIWWTTPVRHEAGVMVWETSPARPDQQEELPLDKSA